MYTVRTYIDPHTAQVSVIGADLQSYSGCLFHAHDVRIYCDSAETFHCRLCRLSAPKITTALFEGLLTSILRPTSISITYPAWFISLYM
jgi:hypothetical protein